jgi:hypothetical protein
VEAQAVGLTGVLLAFGGCAHGDLIGFNFFRAFQSLLFSARLSAHLRQSPQGKSQGRPQPFMQIPASW